MNEQPRGTRPGRITIRDVAADAGVSVAAVSKVLRNAYGVSPALRQNVLTSIEKLGYRPSTAARGMRGRTFTIGVVLVEMGNPFLPDVIAGISDACGADGYKVLIGLGQAQLTLEESLLDSMIDHGMDGLILVAPRMSGETLEAYARQTPLVVIAHHDPAASAYDTVNSDDAAGARLAVAELAARGHSDIAMISLLVADDNAQTHVAVAREKGYMQAMADAGLATHARVLRMTGDKDLRQGQMQAFLAAADRPTAVFCWSDLFAVELIGLARTSGMPLPEDLAVIGYDNSPPAAMPLIALTSVDQNARALGGAAATALLSRISGRTDPQRLMLKPTLSCRTSHSRGDKDNLPLSAPHRV